MYGFEAANNLCQDLHGANASLATFDSVADWVSVLGSHHANGTNTTAQGSLHAAPPLETASGDWHSARAVGLNGTFVGLMYTSWGRKFIWADGVERPYLIDSVDMQLCEPRDSKDTTIGYYLPLLPAGACCATAALREPGTPPFLIEGASDGSPFMSYHGHNSSRFTIRFRPCGSISAVLLCQYPLSNTPAQPPLPPAPPARPPSPPLGSKATLRKSC